MARYKWLDGAWRDEDGNEMEVANSGVCMPTMRSDTPGYFSVASGKWVEGARERRDDLARTGCRPSEPKAKKDLYCTTKKWAEKLGVDWNNSPGAGRPKHWAKDFKSNRKNVNV